MKLLQKLVQWAAPQRRRDRRPRRLRLESLEPRQMMAGAYDFDPGAMAPMTDARLLSDYQWNGVSFEFSVDPQLAAAFPMLKGNFEAAGEVLHGLLAGCGRIEVLVRFDPKYETAQMKEVCWVETGTPGVVEPGTLYEARTGVDPNGAQPDMIIEISKDYLTNYVWFDPSGVKRDVPVPPGKVDCISLALHETLHGLGFYGFRNPYPDSDWGKFLTGKKSTYDALTDWGKGGLPGSGTLSGKLYFVGASAAEVNGGPVWLNCMPQGGGNFYHLGETWGDGKALADDLMGANGYATLGTRRSPSALDLAILHDLGWQEAAWVPKPPELEYHLPEAFAPLPIGPIPPRQYAGFPDGDSYLDTRAAQSYSLTADTRPLAGAIDWLYAATASVYQTTMDWRLDQAYSLGWVAESYSRTSTPTARAAATRIADALFAAYR